MPDDDLAPCSDAARREGCNCRLPHDEYEPEPIINRNCPLHGIDPDAGRDIWEERQLERKRDRDMDR